MKDSLGDRMKDFENVFKLRLPRKHPVIIRIDGKTFHTLTKGLLRPYSFDFIDTMEKTAEYLLENIQNCKMVYVQSDEINLLLDDRTKEGTDCYFGNSIQKLASVTASMTTYKFNQIAREAIEREGMFDSRVFILPDFEVPNYFIWRMRDWERNSIQMLARSMYNQKQIHKKNRSQLMDMMMDKGTNWSKIENRLRNGTILIKREREVIKVSRKFDYKKLKNFIEELNEVKSF